MGTVLVVGAGHAGLEAAFAAARVGADVVVVTGSTATIGQTPCNPSVGGTAKGHLVHEIEAMGGFIGRAADACSIHGRVLNRSKGPAVWSTRLQVDKRRYGEHARASLVADPRIRVLEGMVAALHTTGARTVAGVVLQDGSIVRADAVVVTTGTFLAGVLHTGEVCTPGGRAGEPPAVGLSQQLGALGFALRRLKTGTPPRLDAASIAWAQLEPQPGDHPSPRFVHRQDDPPPALRQVDCHLTWTTSCTHDIVRASLDRSPMFSGRITGRGPRYCPSLEDKVVRFGHRERHQVFLEPEGLDSPSIYPNGISTSLPADVQQAVVRSIPGLGNATLLRCGYAVEYDAVDARVLDHGLGCKDIAGLWLAGQVNGTSGYEEAAAQGLVAGANAALWVRECDPLRIGRDQAYIGVLVDDLVTQGCDEPYRMFTSRAEYRIVLREDNADGRLAELAHRSGLIASDRCDRALARAQRSHALAALLRRGEHDDDAPVWLRARAEAEVLYAGYEERMRVEIARLHGEGGDLSLPIDLEYARLDGLGREIAERLAAVRPASTSQAARIPGMTPAALACLWSHARRLDRSLSAERRK